MGEVVRKMVNEGILAYTRCTELNKAWRSIIPDRSQKVAIKINCQITGIFTKGKVVQPIVDGLLNIGLPADNIIIYDIVATEPEGTIRFSVISIVEDQYGEPSGIRFGLLDEGTRININHVVASNTYLENQPRSCFKSIQRFNLFCYSSN